MSAAERKAKQRHLAIQTGMCYVCLNTPAREHRSTCASWNVVELRNRDGHEPAGFNNEPVQKVEPKMTAGNNLLVTEIKAFVPAKDFDISKQFYKDIGFTMKSEGGGVAYFCFGNASFLLQDFCSESLAENFMMHLLVKDVDAWWAHINDSGVVPKYGVKLWPIQLQPWRMRDFCIADPTGVLWRIGQNVP